MARLLILAAVGIALAGGLASEPPPPGETRVELVGGTLAMSNSKDGAAILTAAGIAPGDSRVGDVTIANTGDLTGTFSLSKWNLGDRPGPAGGTLSTALDLLVQDVTNPGAPATVYAGKLGAMGPRPLGDWAPGASRTYRFTVSLPDGGPPPSETSGDNAYQSSAVSVRYDWTATADEPPPGGTGGGAGVPPAPTPAGPAGGSDTVAPKLTLTGKKLQRLLRHRGLIVFVQCDESSSISARAKGAKGAKKIKLSPWKGQTQPGARVKIKLKLPKKAMKAAKKAMHAAKTAMQAAKKTRKRPAMTVTVRVTDGAGNSTTRRLKVRLR
jgi:hypothetical protein